LNDRIREGLNERMGVVLKLNHSLIQNSIIIFSQTEPQPSRHFVYDRRI
jgi:hypothetical protein